MRTKRSPKPNNPTLVFSNLLNQQRFTQDDFAVDSLNHPSSLSNFGTRIRVEQPFFAGGKLLAGLDAAHERRSRPRMGEQSARRARDGLSNRRAYYGVLLADGNLTTVDRALAAAGNTSRRRARSSIGASSSVPICCARRSWSAAWSASASMRTTRRAPRAAS